MSQDVRFGLPRVLPESTVIPQVVTEAHETVMQDTTVVQGTTRIDENRLTPLNTTPRPEISALGAYVHQSEEFTHLYYVV